MMDDRDVIAAARYGPAVDVLRRIAKFWADRGFGCVLAPEMRFVGSRSIREDVNAALAAVDAPIPEETTP